MLLSTNFFDRPTTDSGISWDDYSDVPLACYQSNLKKSFPNFTKLLTTENLESSFAPFVQQSLPSASFESLSFIQEDGDCYDLEQAPVLEFDDNGKLVGQEHQPTGLQNDYYPGDIFASWENDLFSVALIPAPTSEKAPETVTSPGYPLSPVFSSASSSESDSSNCDSDFSSSSSDSSSSSSDSESDCPRRRSRTKRAREQQHRTLQKKQTTAEKSKPRAASKPKPKPSPSVNKAKKAVSSPDTNFKRRRRQTARRKPIVSDTSAIEILTEITSSLTPEAGLLLRSCPIPKKGKIGLLSGATHELSPEAIRNIFRAEQVVTLTKCEDEDDEEIDIL